MLWDLKKSPRVLKWFEFNITIFFKLNYWKSDVYGTYKIAPRVHKWFEMNINSVKGAEVRPIVLLLPLIVFLPVMLFLRVVFFVHNIYIYISASEILYRIGLRVVSAWWPWSLYSHFWRNWSLIHYQCLTLLNMHLYYMYQSTVAVLLYRRCELRESVECKLVTRQ